MRPPSPLLRSVTMADARLVVSALLRRDGEILLVEQRAPGDPASTWMLPGGVVEAGETALEALRRELREETGLVLRGDPRLAFAVHLVDAAESVLALTFACDADGTPEPDDPDGYVLDVAWIDEGEAIARLGRVRWYDPVPLRRHLAGEPSGLTVVDLR